MPSSPHCLRNGGTTSPRATNPNFHSTVSVQKLRRLNTLILALRLSTFCFSFASAVFMATNSRSGSSTWVDFDAFRFVVAGNAIVALYSLFAVGASVWEILKGTTLFPEAVQVWFDFGHDQGFSFLVLSANTAGTALARDLGRNETCTSEGAFCVQSYISIALGFVGFLFLAFISLLSGFRVACFIITGSRFHM